MNSFGRKFRISIFGESHGPRTGVVIDGVPADMPLSEEDLEQEIARRAPGAKGTTARVETDIPHFLSGMYDSRTTGAPLTIVFDNSNGSNEPDGSVIFDSTPRPGHADYVAAVKWDSANDPRSGGHFSGRITLPLVAAGAVAKKILSRLEKPLKFDAKLTEIGGCSDKGKWKELLDKVQKEGDSLGGVVECRVEGLPIGLGEPFFDSMESLISHLVFAIPGVRGIEFGDGFKAAAMKGSEHNDPFGSDGPLKNGAGGVNGGLSNGAPLLFRVAFKPTSSIAKAQRTYNYETERYEELSVGGRNDACFALRTPVIVESAAAIVITDLLEIF